MKGRHWTKADIERRDKVLQLGCIVCLLHYDAPHTPCEIHHIDGKTRDDAHQRTLGLCHGHHRAGQGTEPFISRHPYKARWEAAYGTEEFLLDVTDRAIEKWM